MDVADGAQGGRLVGVGRQAELGAHVGAEGEDAHPCVGRPDVELRRHVLDEAQLAFEVGAPDTAGGVEHEENVSGFTSAGWKENGKECYKRYVLIECLIILRKV